MEETDPLDYARLGQVLVNALGCSRMLRHVSVLGVVDYALADDGDQEVALLLDILREARPGGDAEATARLNAFIAETNALDAIAAAMV